MLVPCSAWELASLTLLAVEAEWGGIIDLVAGRELKLCPSMGAFQSLGNFSQGTQGVQRLGENS
jgi:hypothetical protein